MNNLFILGSITLVVSFVGMVIDYLYLIGKIK